MKKAVSMIKKTAWPSLSRRQGITSIGLFGTALISMRAAFAVSSSGQAKADDAAWTTLHLAQARVIQIPVTVNGRTVPAMIDSGTSRSVIGEALASDLGLASTGATSVTSFTRNVSGSSYRVDKLELDGLSLRDVELESYEIAQIESLARHEIPLLLGRDILGRIDVQVDFVRDRVRCLPFQGARALSSHRTLPLVGRGPGFPSIPLLLEGRPAQP
ncbi:retropepsin-like domain-containing protein [Novosphingobium sp. KCTC 2891]|uniref:retropepsin-like aspartic protease n=1 Tax=Novosphingobium sp. KCTC 2891 TaxID=2989730 RepID=UPI0022215A96|nr:retropepsin-like aspartic protease [Novosphingobium sp. KCTC 2891]MCW1383794.1 retropepsin-like domain-containing protein [Novosphingobium sp. KCTC 2891]